MEMSMKPVFVSSGEIIQANSNQFFPSTLEWHSSPHCTFPQELGLQLPELVQIESIRFLMHESMIPNKIEVYFGHSGDLDSGTEYSSCRFHKLGHVNFDPNHDNGYCARECKIVDLSSLEKDMPASFIKLLFFPPHPNPFNPHAQVAIVSVTIHAFPLNQDLVLNATSQLLPLGDSQSIFLSHLKQESGEYPPHVTNNADLDNPYTPNTPDILKSPNQTIHARSALTETDLALLELGIPLEYTASIKGCLVDDETGDVLQRLEFEKQSCIAKEDFGKASYIKKGIDMLVQLGNKIQHLQAEKLESIHAEEYSHAKDVQTQLIQLKDLEHAIFSRVHQGKDPQEAIRNNIGQSIFPLAESMEINSNESLHGESEFQIIDLVEEDSFQHQDGMESMHRSSRALIGFVGLVQRERITPDTLHMFDPLKAEFESKIRQLEQEHMESSQNAGTLQVFNATENINEAQQNDHYFGGIEQEPLESLPSTQFVGAVDLTSQILDEEWVLINICGQYVVRCIRSSNWRLRVAVFDLLVEHVELLHKIHGSYAGQIELFKACCDLVARGLRDTVPGVFHSTLKFLIAVFQGEKQSSSTPLPYETKSAGFNLANQTQVSNNPRLERRSSIHILLEGGHKGISSHQLPADIVKNQVERIGSLVLLNAGTPHMNSKVRMEAAEIMLFLASQPHIGPVTIASIVIQTSILDTENSLGNTKSSLQTLTPRRSSLHSTEDWYSVSWRSLASRLHILSHLIARFGIIQEDEFSLQSILDFILPCLSHNHSRVRSGALFVLASLHYHLRDPILIQHYLENLSTSVAEAILDQLNIVESQGLNLPPMRVMSATLARAHSGIQVFEEWETNENDLFIENCNIDEVRKDTPNHEDSNEGLNISQNGYPLDHGDVVAPNIQVEHVDSESKYKQVEQEQIEHRQTEQDQIEQGQTEQEQVKDQEKPANQVKKSSFCVIL